MKNIKGRSMTCPNVFHFPFPPQSLCDCPSRGIAALRAGRKRLIKATARICPIVFHQPSSKSRGLSVQGIDCLDGLLHHGLDLRVLFQGAGGFQVFLGSQELK